MSVTEDIQRDRIAEDEVEIRLSEIVHFLRSSRRLIGLGALVGGLIGVVYAFTQANEYTSEVRVMPELKSPAGAGGLGDLKSLAGLAGVNFDNLGSTSEAIRPDLYPDIVQSIPFVLHLLNQPVLPKDEPKPMTLQQYLTEQADNSLLSRIGLGSDDEAEKQPAAPNKQLLRLTKKQEVLSRKIEQRVGAAIDKKTGIITITSTMPDPVVAATVARQTLDYLTNYVTNYRTGKARNQVQFLGQQVSNARRRYQSAEYALSNYRDRNRSLFRETAKIEEQRLQADYLLTQSVYNDLSKQLEQAKIKVQEEAPVFQLLEPAAVPLRKSGPSRMLIVGGCVILGLFLGLLVAFLRRFSRRYSNRTL